MRLTHKLHNTCLLSISMLLLAVNMTHGDEEAIKEQSTVKRETTPQLKITIETSRSQAAVGTGLGIQAELVNVSDKTFYLAENRITLSVPPEMQGAFSQVSNWWGIFPTQHKWAETDSKGSQTSETWDGTVTIKPGSSYRVVWSTGPSYDSDTRWYGFLFNNLRVVASELNFIFFSPGDYKVSVVAQYWDQPSLTTADYATTTQTATLHVAAPESVILFGSALGGVIAYFIFPLRGRQRSPLDRAARRLFARAPSLIAGLAGAMLLSGIVTILLSRISESQFLVRITVADFWGAIAIGFIANYVGRKIFERLLPLDTSSKQSPVGPAPQPSEGSKGAAALGEEVFPSEPAL